MLEGFPRMFEIVTSGSLSKGRSSHPSDFVLWKAVENDLGAEADSQASQGAA
jgi:hypothetical protein